MNVLGLCAGLGGIELGLYGLYGPGPVCFVERDPYCTQVLRARWPDTPIWDDIHTFDGRPFAGHVACITAGFPCQPFSLAGRQNGTEDERWLWPEVSRIIREIRPIYVFLENVPGILVQSEAFGNVLGDLAAFGFDAEWGVFSAAGCGAPHLRERVFILAHANGKPIWKQSDMLPRSKKAPELRPDGEAQQVANSYSEIPQKGRRAEVWPYTKPDRCSWWSSEPDVGRVVDGFPGRVDRIRALGNAVVPQVAAKAWVTLHGRLHGSES